MSVPHLDQTLQLREITVEYDKMKSSISKLDGAIENERDGFV